MPTITPSNDSFRGRALRSGPHAWLPWFAAWAAFALAACNAIIGLEPGQRRPAETTGTAGSAAGPTGGSGGSGATGVAGEGGSGADAGHVATGGSGGVVATGGGGGVVATGGAGGAMQGGGGQGGSTCTPLSVEDCYTGPPNSENVGTCHGGSWQCNAQGTGWGPCGGQVLPSTDDCGTAEDESCGTLAPACGTCLWSNRYGDAAAQTGQAIAVDGSNRVLVAGDFLGTIDLGEGALTSAGQEDVFAVQLDSQGATLWSSRFGGTAGDRARNVAVDPSDNLLMVGRFSGSINFGGGALTSSGADDVFLAKLTDQGTHVWSQHYGATAGDFGYGVAVDGSSHVVAAGYYNLSVDFGGGALASAGGTDVFLMRRSAAGSHLWSERFGSTAADSGRAVAIDSSDNVLVVGRFRGSVSFGGSLLTSAGLDDIFVAKFDSSGNHLWSMRFGGTGDDTATAVAADSTGNVVVAGAFVGSANFGGGALTSAGLEDAFVAKFDSSGNHLWSKRFGSTGTDSCDAMTVDSSGNVIAVGLFAGSVSFGGPVLASAGSSDGFVVKLSAAAGAHVWSKRFGSASADEGEGVVTDSTGAVLVTGSFTTAANFGCGPLNAAGNTDVFVAKLAP